MLENVGVKVGVVLLVVNLGVWLNNIGYAMKILYPSCQYVDTAVCGFAQCFTQYSINILIKEIIF